MDNNILIIGAIVIGGLLALGLAIWLVCRGIAGALLLFAWAAESGFIGVAAYFACWFFMLPLMLVVCPIVGIGIRKATKADEAAEKAFLAKQAYELAHADEWAEQDRRYEEAKRLRTQQASAD
jgi:hypothetical protein